MRFAVWCRATVSAAISVGLVLGFSQSVATEEIAPQGNVLVIRGVFSVFSLGLDDLASQLKRQGLDVQVTSPSLSYAAAEIICQRRASGQARGPIMLIGHSLGADLLPSLARQFGSQGLWVDLMIMIDSTNPSTVPANVKRCVNLYQSNFSPTWFRICRGAPIKAESLQTQLVNVDIRRLPHQGQADKIDHFNIDESPWIHQMVFREIHHTVSVTARRPPADRSAHPAIGRYSPTAPVTRPSCAPASAAADNRFPDAGPTANRNAPPVPTPSNAPVWRSPRIFP